MWNSRCAWDLKNTFFVALFFRVLVREASPYLSCSLSITMRNVESRPARSGLRTRVLPVCDNKRKEPWWGRESEEEGSGAEWSGEDDGDTEGGRRGEETASKRKRNILSAENEVKRDQEDSEKKKRESGRENRILRTSREERDAASERELVEGDRKKKKRGAMHRSDGDVSEAVQKEKSWRWRWSRRWNGSFVNRD